MDDAWLADVRRQVRRELQAHGGPEEVAVRLADEVVHESTADIGRIGSDPSRLLVWRGTGRGLSRPDDPEDVEAAVVQLVQDVVDDNAECHDRHLRGEPGYEPLWPLPDRQPRNRQARPG